MVSDKKVKVNNITYYPYGDRLQSQGDLGTDKLFTGQRLDDTRGLSLFPGIISIRTDFTRTAKEFTWDVAHELYHQFEMSVFGPVWYWNYMLELGREHDLRTSEKTANAYADKHFRLP